MGKSDLPEQAETVFVRDIESRVFQVIILECLGKIPGIALVGGTLFDNILGRAPNERLKGIHVDQDPKNHSVKIKIEVNIAYGVSIPEKADEVQSKISTEVTKLTGVHVASVHVIFKGVISEEEKAAAAEKAAFVEED